MVCFFKKSFLKDLSGLPRIYRQRIERLVFDVIPGIEDILSSTTLDVKKIQGREDYYRIRIGDYRVGCRILPGAKIILYRAKHRKDIYRLFP